MMEATEWQKGIDAWEKIQKQAEIDLELAEVVITALKNKISTIKKGEDNGK